MKKLITLLLGLTLLVGAQAQLFTPAVSLIGGGSPPIVFTDIGIRNSVSPAVLTTTAGVPAGSLIVVVIADQTTESAPTIVDSAGNTYRLANSQALNGGSGGYAVMYYAYNCLALALGGTITYTSNGGGTSHFSAAFATNVQTSADPLDAVGGSTAYGSSPSASATATQPTGALFVGVVSTGTSSSGPFTQPTGFAVPPTPSVTTDFISGSRIGGGTQTYNPTQTGASYWGAILAVFKHK